MFVHCGEKIFCQTYGNLLANTKDEWIENSANGKTPFFLKIFKAIIISKEKHKIS